MKVAFHLRRRPEAVPATALLLPSHRVDDLIRLGVQLGGDRLPPIFAVADGLVIKLPVPTRQAFPGALRLRALAENLFLPVDGELVPTLLEDEAAALVRQRGLVFLPGGSVLEFAPGQPLPSSSLVAATQLQRPDWQPLPQRPPLADRLNEITLDLPDVPPDDLLAAGGEGIGTEEPGPPDAALPSKLAGKAALQAGKGMVWLGKALHWRGLTRAGAQWVARGLTLAPRLSEALLGRQEAALRALLQDFKAGNIERALRRALPLGGDTPRGTTPAVGDRLPTHNLLYSLQDLLGAADGPASAWFDRSNAYQELQNEYRKQAEAATRRGDYRRAAFIYGKLLHDYRSAANILAQGGLHHDAAVLYQAKLGDLLAAAREYEAAGALDRALQIYRQRAEHELAADLLRRAGEEELAIAEYRLAADKVAASGQGHYQAGEMLRIRARRPDLAMEYYAAGWAQRLHDHSVACAIRLAQLHVQDEAVERLLDLLAEAEQFLNTPGNEGPAAEFYNEVARLADEPALVRVRDDLRDRALLGLAVKMRQRLAAGRAAAGNPASAMFGQSAAWAAPVISDAHFAVKSTLRRAGNRLPSRTASLVTTVIQGRIPTVTAVCWAEHAGCVFLGFQSGEVICYRPLRGEVVALHSENMPVTSLASSGDGDALVVLRTSGFLVGSLSSLRVTDSGCRVLASQAVTGSVATWLCPTLAGNEDLMAGFWDGEQLQFLRLSCLIPEIRWRLPFDHPQPGAVLLLRGFDHRTFSLGALVLDGTTVHYHGDFPDRKLSGCKTWVWQLCLPHGSTLKYPPLSWLRKGLEELELAGIGPEGGVFSADMKFRDGTLATVSAQSCGLPEPCLAVGIIKAGRVAAVTPKAIHWLRRGAESFSELAATEVSLPGALACFPHVRSNELIVVCGEGTVARLPLGC